jgi:L-asparaginase II
VASLGNATRQTYYRSAAKPLQALPLVEEGIADRFGITPAELALCCASHEAEGAHLAGVRSILAKAGADESFLHCGPHAPLGEEAARKLASAGVEPAPIHNNCSGKHAGMVALAIGMGWDPRDYHSIEHPVQQRMLAEIVRWTALDATRIATGIDGCGVTCFAVPLDVMAASFARFAEAACREGGPRRIVEAMTSHPFMVGGSGRACTDIMLAAGDRVFVKLGAEGVYGGALRGRGIGFALKVADGARRAVEVALVHLLDELGLIGPDQLDALRSHGRPEVRNTRDQVVGDILPRFSLERHPPVE